MRLGGFSKVETMRKLEFRRDSTLGDDAQVKYSCASRPSQAFLDAPNHVHVN